MKKIWSFEKLQQEALKYLTRSEFQKKSAGAYHAAAKNNELEVICKHMPKHADQSGENHPMFKWTNKELEQEALKYKTKTEFAKKSIKAYRAAYRRKILDQFCFHMPKRVDQSGINNPSFKWKNEELQQEALKYKTRNEFRQKNNGAYQITKKRGLLEEFCVHMPKRNSSLGEKHYNFKWTLEKLQQEALKYKSRGEFQENSRKAYDTAHKRKILDEICQYMKKSSGTSKPEQELFNRIKYLYPKAQKLRISAKNNQSLIKTKPHIQGFDLDIYIPELRRGIEFDGNYWHSVEGLKRSRQHWPEVDLINYHKIKDEYFLKNHGIEILHINGEDWKNNKEKCLIECWEFLNTFLEEVA